MTRKPLLIVLANCKLQVFFSGSKDIGKAGTTRNLALPYNHWVIPGARAIEAF
jgi:hypothetical protein